MSQANDSILVTPGSGATIATHLVNSKEHQVVMVANEFGHIQGSLPTYTYNVALAAGATNKIYIELFNATGSGKVVKLRKLFVVSNSAAVVGVPINWTVFKTSAVGTGGSTVTARSSDSVDGAPHANITARTVPTGGATTDFEWMSFYTTSEETIAANAIAGTINWLPENPVISPYTLNENQGMKLVHVTNSTTGSWLVTLVVTIE